MAGGMDDLLGLGEEEEVHQERQPEMMDDESHEDVFGSTSPPAAAPPPPANGDMTFELTNDTTLKIKARGSDGIVREASLVLA